jgi:hypothetical protein
MEASSPPQVVQETASSIAPGGSSINNARGFGPGLDCFHFSCRDWTASTLAAEKACQTYPTGPYSQEIAKLWQRKTIFSHMISSKKKGISFDHAICHLSSDVTGLWPMSLEACQQEYQTLVKKIKEIEWEDQGLLHKRNTVIALFLPCTKVVDCQLMRVRESNSKGNALYSPTLQNSHCTELSCQNNRWSITRP